MWNPPPPEFQISVSPHASSSRARQNAPRFKQVNHDNLPNLDSNSDRPFPPENDSIRVDVDNSNANQDNGHGNVLSYIAHTTTIGRPLIKSTLPHPKLEKVGPYITIATLQAYTVLTVVRCLADPAWIVLKSGNNTTTDGSNPTQLVEIGLLERVFLSCAIWFTMLSCAGVTLRIMDKLPWLRRIPVITAYLEGIYFTHASRTTYFKTEARN
ncbi:hypothetical protein BGX26_001666 [Mortierella sp. AD094]|nr:hypothetical protein BGX26_001666 [Mortierella sp. AD094]